ncbi:MAG: excinuclease ABC subunit UvrA [bacterium]
MNDKISIKGARVHNLKNIDIDIPRNKFIVITGLSGSGKSSLAFDVIYAEGQRRFLESISNYARQFLGVMDKPDVDQIEGLSPVISIDQRSAAHNPRSTVGTMTEVYDCLRVLFARAGTPYCPNCNRPISEQTTDQIIEKILQLPDLSHVLVLSPAAKNKKIDLKKQIRWMKEKNMRQLRWDGDIYNLSEAGKLNPDNARKHSLDIIVDQCQIDKKNKLEILKLTNAVRRAIEISKGIVIVHLIKENREIVYSQQYACPNCEFILSELEPRSFSFNGPLGACPDCTGLGTKSKIDPDLIIPNKKLSISQGAVKPWTKIFSNKISLYPELEKLAKKYKFSLDTPIYKYSYDELKIALFGDGDTNGIITDLEKKYKETDSDYVKSEIERYMRMATCPTCKGKRLKPEYLAVKLNGLSIMEICQMTIADNLDFFEKLAGSKTLEKINDANSKNNASQIAKQVFSEIKNRLRSLQDVGLDYLSLSRSSTTLAGGEMQRIRLATQLSSSLVGVTYILDEPSVGLHPRDNDKLIKTLLRLRDLGNTVMVVEHDEKIIEAAEQIIDVGPGAGEHGGEIVAQGTLDEIKKNKNSLTGKYLSGEMKIKCPKKLHDGNNKFLTIKNAREYNLKNINVKIPLQKFVCITGVSGSGKSTLMTDILAKALARKFYQAKDLPGAHDGIDGVENLNKVINIDQSPIGRVPRSNPATYTGLFNSIRDLYANLPEAKTKGYKTGHFSFNVSGGRCEACAGEGFVKIDMQFLSDVYIECERCRGKRYNAEALSIYYRGKNIADILAMTVEEALIFFDDNLVIKEKLAALDNVGLGYIKLGQPANTLSGGEAQRIKLATELSRRATGKTLYILDEPTTGLHFDDIKKLLDVLIQLVDKGNTVMIVEHNLDVIKCADWVIDIGPEGGVKGGYIVAEGTPQEIAKVKESYTGQYLKKVLC